MLIEAHFCFSTLFSYKNLKAGGSCASACPIPSPKTIKMALISRAISQYGKEYAKKLFYEIKDANIYFKIPNEAFYTNYFINKITVSSEESGKFVCGFGYRESVFYNSPIIIYIESDGKLDKTIESLKLIRYLGNASSLGTFVEIKLLNDKLLNINGYDKFKICHPFESIKEMIKKDDKYIEYPILQLEDFSDNITFLDMVYIPNHISKIFKKVYYNFPHKYKENNSNFKKTY